MDGKARDHLTNYEKTAQIVRSALGVGTLAGGSGVIVGSIVGIVRSAHPILFAAISGVQWSVLGSTFWGSRAVILNAWGMDLERHTQASTLAGIFSGGVTGALTRGRRNAIPGALVFGLFGYAGQHVYNIMDSSHSANLAIEDPRNLETDQYLWHRIATSKWLPVRVWSDEEHENILKEKLLAIDAELAIVDEDMQDLRITRDTEQH